MRISSLPSACVRSALLLASLAGCGGASAPGVLVGESEHFRLFVDPDLNTATIPATMQGTAGLTALETDWADKQTMLHMPSGRKIDYHLVTEAHVVSTCGFPSTETLYEGSGCELEKLIVVAPYLPHQHELIHAYMELLAPGVTPLSLVTEGTADAIACNNGTWTTVSINSPWQQVVLETPFSENSDVYGQGSRLVRHLIRTQGTDAFIRYYRQAPQRRDPALFAANFLAFWAMTIDDVWAAAHVDPPGSDNYEQPICPCSLPALPADATPIPDDVTTHPYWTVPGVPGVSLALSPVAGQALQPVKDCQGVLPDLPSGNADSATVFLIPSDNRLRYVAPPVAAAAADVYVSDTCEGAVPYPLPAGPLGDGGTSLNISLIQQTNDSQTFYLEIQSAAPIGVPVSQTVQACDTCDFTQRFCNTVPAPDAGLTRVVEHFRSGPVYLKITLPAQPVSSSPPFATSVQVLFQ